MIESLDIALEKTGIGTRVAWAPVPDAMFYDVIRGDLNNIVDAGVVINLGAVVCVTHRHEDSDLPSPGQTFFYLVEFDDGISNSYGTDSAQKPRAPGPGACQ